MILGIDLGQKTTGLATSDSSLATPYTTIKHQSIDEAVIKISQICQDLKIDKVVIGFVEGKIKSSFLNFAKSFEKQNPGLEIIMRDETLTTRQAQDALIKLRIPKTKRKLREHQVAAAIILQSYLDENA